MTEAEHDPSGPIPDPGSDSLTDFIRGSLSRRQLLKAGALGAVYLATYGCAPPSKPASGNRDVTIILGSPPTSLDLFNSTQYDYLRNISESLCRIGRNQFPSAGPLLATSWSNPEPTRWRFNLRQGVKFQNGNPFNAEAAVYSINSYKQKGTARANWDPIDHAVAVDDHTIDIITGYPSGILTTDLSAVGGMLDQAWETGPSFTPDSLMGTGPGKVAEWVKGDHLTLEANPTYWGGPLGFSRVIYRSLSDAASRANAAITGEGDIVANILPQDVTRVNQSGKARIMTANSVRTQVIRIRDDVAPFDNKLVRQALNYAVNVPDIIKSVFLGYGQPLQGQMQGSNARFWQKGVQAYPYDPEKAKSLLAQAGYPNGFTTQIGTANGFDQGDYQFTQAIVGQLAQVGVTCQVNVHEAADYVQILIGAKLGEPLFYWGIGNFIPDPEVNLHDLSVARADGHPYVSDPQMKALYQNLRVTLDDTSRNAAALAGIEFIRDYCPVIFGVQAVQIYAVSNRVNWKPRQDPFSIYLNEISVH